MASRKPAPGPVDLDPMSQHELEVFLRKLDQEIVDQIEVIAQLQTSCAEAEHRFKVNHARSLLASKQPSREMREAEALVANEPLNWAYKSSSAQLAAAVEKGRMLRARAELARSLNANVRDAVTHSSGEGW